MTLECQREKMGGVNLHFGLRKTRDNSKGTTYVWCPHCQVSLKLVPEDFHWGLKTLGEYCLVKCSACSERFAIVAVDDGTRYEFWSGVEEDDDAN